jgi:hypothetical protein
MHMTPNIMEAVKLRRRLVGHANRMGELINLKVIFVLMPLENQLLDRWWIMLKCSLRSNSLSM